MKKPTKQLLADPPVDLIFSWKQSTGIRMECFLHIFPVEVVLRIEWVACSGGATPEFLGAKHKMRTFEGEKY